MGITSTRQSCAVRRLIQRVPGMGLVLTTRYFPLGFHTSIDIGFAIINLLRTENKAGKE